MSTVAPAGANLIHANEEAAAELRDRERKDMGNYERLIREGCYCFELVPPLPVRLPEEQQVELILKNSVLVDCNSAMARMYGCDEPREMLGRSIGDLFLSTDPRNHESVHQFIRADYQAQDIETHEVGRDGRTLYFLNNCHGEIDNDLLTRIWGTQVDITAQRLAEDNRQLRESRYSQMLDHMEISVFMKDRDLRLVAVNRRHCENLGAAEADLIGKSDFDLYPNALAEKYRADDLLVLTQDRKVELEEQTLIRGDQRTVRVIKSPVHDSLGRVVGVMGVFWDVTDQRAVETQFRRAQKMDAISQLAAGVANDFNNMLTAMLGNLDLLGKHLPPDGPLRAFFDGAEAAATRASTLIDRLTSFSRRSVLQLSPIPPRELAAEIAAELKALAEPKIHVEMRQPDEIWLVHADRAMVRQVLLALSQNAIDAMPEGGTLTLETLNIRIEEDYLRTRPQARPGEFVCFQVSDTGIGIPEPIRQQLFEPFVTTKGGGKNPGLGLAMSFSLVERHGGWIEFQTKENLGTTFSVFMPRYQAPIVPSSTENREDALVRGNNETVLFVEDEEIIRRLGNTILNRHGYKVLLAADGHEALRIYRHNPDNVDLVVLDLSMPGLSGRDVFRRLKAFNPEVRVVFTSGQFDELAAQNQEDPSYGCIGKPYRAEDFARTIRMALDADREKSDRSAVTNR